MTEYCCLACASWGFTFEVEQQPDPKAATATPSSENAPAAVIDEIDESDESGGAADTPLVGDDGLVVVPSMKG